MRGELGDQPENHPADLLVTAVGPARVPNREIGMIMDSGYTIFGGNNGRNNGILKNVGVYLTSQMKMTGIS